MMVLFNFALLVLVLQNIHGSSLNRSIVLEIAQKLCPEASICPEKQTYKTTSWTIHDYLEPCCADCSCGPDCHDYGNCCFAESFPSDEGLNNMTSQTLAEVDCLVPASIQPNDKDRIHYSSYSMISSIHDANSNQSVKCGDEKVAPWGSLYPAYSPSTKRIYKNMACAAADGVRDGILWDAIIYCNKHRDVHKFDASIPTQWLTSSSESDICRLHFTYSGDAAHIKPLKCFGDLISTCNGEEFQIPSGIDMSYDEIKEACTSGLWSPYRRTGFYKNIFCHICNSELSGFSYEISTCSKQFDVPPRSAISQTFAGLLDPSRITAELQVTSRAWTPHRPCVKLADGECMDVFCPSGQLWDSTGRCRYLTNYWYYQDYKIFLELILDHDSIDVDKVFDLHKTSMSYNLPDFSSPWSEPWTIGEIFIAEGQPTHNVTRLYIVMHARLSTVNPDVLIGYVRKTISKKWTLRSDNVTYTFRARFMIGHDVYRYIEPGHGNQNKTVPEIRLRRLYLSFLMPKNEPHIITKLYTCDQVDLEHSKFELSPFESILFNTVTGRNLYINEFTLIYQPLMHVRARVCIEDSGIKQVDLITSSHGASIYGDHKSSDVMASIALIIVYMLFW